MKNYLIFHSVDWVLHPKVGFIGGSPPMEPPLIFLGFPFCKVPLQPKYIVLTSDYLEAIFHYRNTGLLVNLSFN